MRLRRRKQQAVIDRILRRVRAAARRTDLVKMPEQRIVHPAWILDALGPQRLRDLEAEGDLCLERRRGFEVRVAQLVEHGVELFFTHGGETGGAEVAHDVCLFGGEADGEDHAEIEGCGFEAEGDAVAGECVLEGVADDVVGLAAVSDDARAGGKQDEEVELLGEHVVEIPGGLDFWPHGCVVVFYGHVCEYGVLRWLWLAATCLDVVGAA